jgi:Arc/MetJ-type ribon-helix-helix transcriptional regulator
MQLTPEQERRIEALVSSGAYSTAEEALDAALHALEYVSDRAEWPQTDLETISAHIEEGCRQAERGELIDGDEARRQIQEFKDQWLQQHAPR